MNLSSSVQEGAANPSEELPSHLLVILETHPSAYASNVSLPVLLSDLLLLINAHLSLSHQNSASFVASVIVDVTAAVETPSDSEVGSNGTSCSEPHDIPAL